MQMLPFLRREWRDATAAAAAVATAAAAVATAAAAAADPFVQAGQPLRSGVRRQPDQCANVDQRGCAL